MSNPSLADIKIYVFSFNRGVFLENCLRSVEICAANCEVVVIDDQSYDKKTQEVLDHFSHKLPILIAGEQAEVEHKTGGLYNNMRVAFSDAREKGFRYALFLQDDMQLVRPIMKNDIVFAERFFAANKNSAELHTCFMKRYFSKRDEQLTKIDDSGIAYLRPSDYSGFSGFSAVGLFDVARFFDLFGNLKKSEYINNEFAQKNNIQMGISTRPFMMWLPYPISHRGRKRDIPLQIVEYVGGCGFHPYSIMSTIEINALFNRKIQKRPYAEEWLISNGLENIRVWGFAGGVSNLLARGGIRAWLGSILNYIKRVLG